MKPYLISITSDVKGVKENYLGSLYKLESSVEPVMVTFEPQPPQGYLAIIPVGCSYPGNLARFNYFPQGLKDEDMCIFTDASDVIFQGPIPKLDQKIYVCPEYASFDEHSWFHSQFERFNFHGLDNTPIYNMGTWAMPFYKVKELVTFLVENKEIFPNWTQSDQPLYNLWLQTEKFSVHPTLMTCLFNSIAAKKAVKTDDVWVNEDGEPYSIVHANGNQKHLLVKEYL